MLDKTLVSVIIPVFRVEKYIRACVDSVLEQTYSNLEIILVDDGSDDGCPAICDFYAELDERVKVIHQKNGGLSAARNTGITASKGEYVAFVDSDDVVAPEYIEQLLFACHKYGTKISICNYMAVRDEFQFLTVKKVHYWMETQREIVLKNAESMEMQYIVAWCKLFHHSLFDEIRFPEEKLHEDEFISWKLFLKTDGAAIVDAILYYYRKHHGSIMGTEFTRWRLDAVAAKQEKAEYHDLYSSAEIAFASNRSLYHLLLYCYSEMPQYYPFDTELIGSLRDQIDDLEGRFGDRFLIKGVKKSYLFPFQHIQKGQRVIIYGAGTVGREYYRQAKAAGWCSQLHIVDKNNITTFSPVESIDYIFQVNYDILLIALENDVLAGQVRKMLLNLGVFANKIKWFLPDVDQSCKKTILWDRLSRELNSVSLAERIYLMNTPDHGNLGDHALALVALEELGEKYPEAEICEVTGFQWDWFKERIIPRVQRQEHIFIHGGGSIGSLWKNEDSRIKDIIRSFPDNRIVILPQTVYFATDTSEQELAREREFYETYQNVHIIHRERNSYEWFRRNILPAEGRSSLEPDLALKLKIKINLEQEKKGILCCFRSDHERIVSGQFMERLREFFKRTEEVDYKFINTVVNHMILPDDRESELTAFLRRIAEARLVITDRLHGMVFAYLSGTPCVAVDNRSQKVSGVYEWIRNCPYVICVEEDSVTPELLMEYYKKGGKEK